MLLNVILVVMATLLVMAVLWFLFTRKTPRVRTVMRRMDRGEHPFTTAEVEGAILDRFGGTIIRTDISEADREEALRRAIRERLEESAELHRRGIPDRRGKGR